MELEKIETVCISQRLLDLSFYPYPSASYLMAEVRDGQGATKLIIRAPEKEIHYREIAYTIEREFANSGLQFKILGGGTIAANREEKKITVYDYSLHFGRADHAKTAELISPLFPGYSIHSR